jgi:hypothetical protein
VDLVTLAEELPQRLEPVDPERPAELVPEDVPPLSSRRPMGACVVAIDTSSSSAWSSVHL